MEGERDTARNEATVAQEKIVELQKEILSYQRQLHNSDADRLRAMQQVNCKTKMMLHAYWGSHASAKH